MRSRPYKVFINNRKLINCATIIDVKTVLAGLKNDVNFKSMNVEIFDPISGWDFASKWIELKKQN